MHGMQCARCPCQILAVRPCSQMLLFVSQLQTPQWIYTSVHTSDLNTVSDAQQVGELHSSSMLSQPELRLWAEVAAFPVVLGVFCGC